MIFLPLSFAGQAHFIHQSLDLFVVGDDAVVSQGSMDSANAVSLFVFVEDVFDVFLQFPVFVFSAESLQFEIIGRFGQARYRQKDGYAAFGFLLDGLDDFRLLALAG